VIDRCPPYIVADERVTLLTFLRYLREAVARKAQGVGDRDARQVCAPSGTSLAGLVKHLTDSERFWFGYLWAGLDPVRLAGDMPFAGDWKLDEDELVADLVDAYRASWSEVDALIAGAADLDVPCAREYRGHRLTLRWVLVQMIEETARHAGHADIARELVDGTTGR
jgi:hypothetical protein